MGKAPANREKPPRLDGGFSGSSKLLLGGVGADFLVLAAEALDTASGIHQLLLASEERVARGADFNVDVALVRGPGAKGVAARAVHADFVIVGVDGCLHDASKPFLQKINFSGFQAEFAT